MKKLFLIIAGLINLFTAFLHTISGQRGLIDPMQESGLSLSVKTQLLGVWHMITLCLFASSIVLLYYGFFSKKIKKNVILSIGVLYALFAIAFLMASAINNHLASQWILLLLIGLLSILSLKFK